MLYPHRGLPADSDAAVLRTFIYTQLTLILHNRYVYKRRIRNHDVAAAHAHRTRVVIRKEARNVSPMSAICRFVGSCCSRVVVVAVVAGGTVPSVVACCTLLLLLVHSLAGSCSVAAASGVAWVGAWVAVVAVGGIRRRTTGRGSCSRPCWSACRCWGGWWRAWRTARSRSRCRTAVPMILVAAVGVRVVAVVGGAVLWSCQDRLGCSTVLLACGCWGGCWDRRWRSGPSGRTCNKRRSPEGDVLQSSLLVAHHDHRPHRRHHL